MALTTPARSPAETPHRQRVEPQPQLLDRHGGFGTGVDVVQVEVADEQSSAIEVGQGRLAMRGCRVCSVKPPLGLTVYDTAGWLRALKAMKRFQRWSMRSMTSSGAISH